MWTTPPKLIVQAMDVPRYSALPCLARLDRGYSSKNNIKTVRNLIPSLDAARARVHAATPGPACPPATQCEDELLPRIDISAAMNVANSALARLLEVTDLSVHSDALAPSPLSPGAQVVDVSLSVTSTEYSSSFDSGLTPEIVDYAAPDFIPGPTVARLHTHVAHDAPDQPPIVAQFVDTVMSVTSAPPLSLEHFDSFESDLQLGFPDLSETIDSRFRYGSAITDQFEANDSPSPSELTTNDSMDTSTDMSPTPVPEVSLLPELANAGAEVPSRKRAQPSTPPQKKQQQKKQRRLNRHGQPPSPGPQASGSTTATVRQRLTLDRCATFKESRERRKAQCKTQSSTAITRQQQWRDLGATIPPQQAALYDLVNLAAMDTVQRIDASLVLEWYPTTEDGAPLTAQPQLWTSSELGAMLPMVAVGPLSLDPVPAAGELTRSALFVQRAIASGLVPVGRNAGKTARELLRRWQKQQQLTLDKIVALLYETCLHWLRLDLLGLDLPVGQVTDRGVLATSLLEAANSTVTEINKRYAKTRTIGRVVRHALV